MAYYTKQDYQQYRHNPYSFVDENMFKLTNSIDFKHPAQYRTNLNNIYLTVPLFYKYKQKTWYDICENSNADKVDIINESFWYHKDILSAHL